jgi:hypothetical protein
MKAAASYDLAMSTGSSITSQDTFFFNHSGQIDTSCWVEPLVAKMTLKHMWALCANILCEHHTVTARLRLALQRRDNYEMTMHNKYACLPDTWTMEVLYPDAIPFGCPSSLLAFWSDVSWFSSLEVWRWLLRVMRAGWAVCWLSFARRFLLH